MSQQTDLVAPDGIVNKPLTEESQASRRSFLALTAAACGAALISSGTPAHALDYGDQRLLRFLEEVENLQREFFTRAALSGTADGLSQREAAVLNQIAQHDAQHSSWAKLAGQKFGTGVDSRSAGTNQESSRPAYSYSFRAKSFENRNAFYSEALNLKQLAVGAYYGVVARADEPRIVQAVASLAGVEGRHLALLKEMAGQDPFVAYEKPLAPREVAKKLLSYGFPMEVL